MEYEAYPKCLYHATKDPVIVQDEKEHKALGKGWQETPVEKKESEASQ
jgi:hypothetical protein